MSQKKQSKAQRVINFVQYSKGVIDTANLNKKATKFDLHKLQEQQQSVNFTPRENAGADFLEKYDMVPGTLLYAFFIKPLSNIKFDDMTYQQKQMVMLIFCAGLFYGWFERINDELHAHKDTSAEQFVALDLMAQDVDMVHKNLISTLKEIEKNGVSKKTKQDYETHFSTYAPHGYYGPNKKSYDPEIFNQCKKWATNPTQNKDKIQEYKDYFITQLNPNYYVSLFPTMYDTLYTSLQNQSDFKCFTNWRTVSLIGTFIQYLRFYTSDKYILAPSLNLYAKCMREGTQQSILKKQEDICKANKTLQEFHLYLTNMYDKLPEFCK